MPMSFEDIMGELSSLADPRNVESMARFGIRGSKVLGISVRDLRRIARKAGNDHNLASSLWGSGVHEARILASMVDEPAKVVESQMERWAREFDSWDVCDQCCMNLFRETPFAYKKAAEWASRHEEYVKRAGFALMACLASGDKKADDAKFVLFLPIIKTWATDERNYVKKAVNWALRQIGKRNASLNRMAIEAAEDIGKLDSKAARWVAANALRELRGEAVQRMLKGKS